MSTAVRDVPQKSRYEVTVDGRPAGHSDYRLRGDRVVFTHAEIDPAFEGLGVGSDLAQAALDDVRRRGLFAVPLCPFIKGWIERHPDYQDLVAP